MPNSKNNPSSDSSRYYPVNRQDFMMGKFKIEIENEYITLYRANASHGITITNKDLDNLIDILAKVKGMTA